MHLDLKGSPLHVLSALTNSQNPCQGTRSSHDYALQHIYLSIETVVCILSVDLVIVLSLKSRVDFGWIFKNIL